MLAELLFNRLEKEAGPAVSFAAKRCLRSRLRGHACNICSGLCGKQALTIDDGQVVFNPERCTDCMICVSACPNDAFEGGFDIRTMLPALRQRRFTGPVVISCDRGRHGADRIIVPCLGVLSEPVLAALYCMVPEGLQVDIRDCSACDNHHILDLLDGRMRRLAQKAGPTAPLAVGYCNVRDQEDTRLDHRRRSFLRLVGGSLHGLGREASVSLRPAERPGPSAGLMDKRISAVTSLLHQALESAPPDNDGHAREVLLSYLFTLEANENCDLCPLCTGMCPTGALKRRTDEHHKQLVFAAAGCGGCGLCVAFCRKKALKLSSGATIPAGFPALSPPEKVLART